MSDILNWDAGVAQSPWDCEPESASQWDGLMALWVPMLGPTGVKLYDLSPNANHGTLTGMDPNTDWIVGERGYSIDFGGTDDYVALPKNLTLMTTSNIAMLGFEGVWTAGASQWFYHSEGSTSNYGAGFGILSNGHPEIFGAGVNEFVFSNITVPSGIPFRILFRRKVSNGTTTCFVLASNGYYASQVVNSVNWNTDPTWSSGPWIGRLKSYYFVGSMYSLLIGSRMWEVNEVRAWLTNPTGLITLAEETPWWAVEDGGAEAQTVAVSLAGAGPTAYAPTAIPGSIAALPAAASRAPTAFNPTAAPGSITAAPSVAARSVAAFDATSSPGAASALPGAAARTAQAFTPTAVLGAVTASPDFASRVAQAFEASAATGVLTADVGVAARTAQAFALTALPGAVIADVQAALREAVALQAVALVGSTIVTVNAAQRTATAYAVVGVPGAIIALPETASRIARAFTARIAGIGDTGWMLVYLESGRYI